MLPSATALVQGGDPRGPGDQHRLAQPEDELDPQPVGVEQVALLGEGPGVAVGQPVLAPPLGHPGHHARTLATQPEDRGHRVQAGGCPSGWPSGSGSVANSEGVGTAGDSAGTGSRTVLVVGSPAVRSATAYPPATPTQSSTKATPSARHHMPDDPNHKMDGR